MRLETGFSFSALESNFISWRLFFFWVEKLVSSASELNVVLP